MRYFVILLLVFCTPAYSSGLDLRHLVRGVEDQYMGASSTARMTMRVSTVHWQRTTEMDAWSLGRDHFLVRIREPARERGVATLKVGREVWNYLHKVDRTIKIPPSMMGGAWMGSHITNNDLVKAAHVDEDYDFTLLSEDQTSWTVEGTPRPDAAVIWGKIIYHIEKQRRVPLQISYFDEDMIEVRRISFDRVKKIDDRFIPLRMTVRPLEKPGEKTILEYRELNFNIDLKPAFFSLRNLRRR
ncbi:outer membrane lipoprotein-sorting protein [Geothermobacter hydrogeniphilus]|uniref:Outer membrane lipoprotein-sorting protein n=1 Tax=Geothermobacter hydrogeniphilus TaxID=1969733 RepID=A0A1X0YD14_9BACT|nr:outer membrane lipoprotein-sorting protein [Geothermobacter hydrogeniphilus]ORJ62973.1 outer membrane lipoprotein-sorting protein [Geothermobacter hydrogeniphilus]